MTPLLRVHSAEATSLGDRTWRVRLVVQNDGWLPTNVTEKAVEKKLVRPVEAEITLPEGAILVTGTAKIELGQLSGRSRATTMTDIMDGAGDATVDRAKAEWFVEAPPGTEVTLTARHPRAGVVRTEVTLS